MKIVTHYKIIYTLCIIYFIWIIYAISKNKRSLLDTIVSMFKEDGAMISMFMMIVTILFLVYTIHIHENDPNEQESVIRLRKMLLLSLMAFSAAWFGHIDLWIAPFFFTLMLTGVFKF